MIWKWPGEAAYSAIDILKGEPTLERVKRDVAEATDEVIASRVTTRRSTNSERGSGTGERSLPTAG